MYERVTCLVAYKNVEVRIVQGFMRTRTQISNYTYRWKGSSFRPPSIGTLSPSALAIVAWLIIVTLDTVEAAPFTGSCNLAAFWSVHHSMTDLGCGRRIASRMYIPICISRSALPLPEDKWARRHIPAAESRQETLSATKAWV